MRRKKRSKSFIFFLLALAGVGLAIGLYLHCRFLIYPPSADNNPSPQTITIQSGQSVEQIAKLLEENKIIRSPFWFKFFVWRKGVGERLQAGKYQLTSAMPIPEIIDILAAGKVVNEEKTITIIEGWTLEEIAQYLKKGGHISSQEEKRLLAARVGEWPFSFAKPDFFSSAPASASLEGYLFPDTYRLAPNATLEDILQKMFNNFSAKLSPQMRADIQKSGYTLHQIITLASIVEKEVRNPQEMKVVAGILHKRLKMGMKLEVDSTVNYLTKKKTPSASWQDLQIDSPYNTYKYYGLPPGPIASPGLAAIQAAIYPQESPYLFYLNRQDTGETIFSRTYQEHLRNKRLYWP